MFGVRCFTCGKVTGDLYEKYRENISVLKDEGKCRGFEETKALDMLSLKRDCCRRMFLSYTPAVEEANLLYAEYDEDRTKNYSAAGEGPSGESPTVEPKDSEGEWVTEESHEKKAGGKKPQPVRKIELSRSKRA